MKLKDLSLSKGALYDEFYTRIIPDFKEYNDIDEDEMLKAIIKEYSDVQNIIDICTVDELKALEHIINGTFYDCLDDSLDIASVNLNKKLLIDQEMNIYEELLDFVTKALKVVKYDEKEEKDRISYGAVAFLKVYAEIPEPLFIGLIKGTFGVSSEDAICAINSKLTMFYSIKHKIYFDDVKQEVNALLYHDYFNYMNIFDEAREKYFVLRYHNFSLKELENIFMYGFDIDNKYVKKMYDIMNGSIFKPYIEDLINYTVMSGDSKLLLEKLSECCSYERPDYLVRVFKKALKNIPHPCMNGNTPNERRLFLKYKKTVGESVIQNSACLTKKESDLFYKLFFALLEFTNDKYKINSSIERISNNKNVLLKDIIPIIDVFWDNKSIIIDEFVSLNKYKLNDAEIESVKGFNNSKTGTFYIVRHDYEYSEVMNDEGIIYMVKGINDYPQKLFPSEILPFPVKTTLLMFDGKLVFGGIISPCLISDSTYLNMIISDYSRAIKYYHL